MRQLSIKEAVCLYFQDEDNRYLINHYRHGDRTVVGFVSGGIWAMGLWPEGATLATVMPDVQKALDEMTEGGAQ